MTTQDSKEGHAATLELAEKEVGEGHWSRWNGG